MLGLMQDWPLTMDKVMQHAVVNHGGQEVVTRTVEGPMLRLTYGGLENRARRLSGVLRRRYGVRLGDRVATLGWNTHRHLETWYAAAGIGAVHHPLNPLASPELLTTILDEAGDKVLLADISFVPLLEKIAPALAALEGLILYADDDHMPDTTLDAVAYETVLEEAEGSTVWGGFDERTAAGLFYTSGAGGRPKGVLYSHRSNVLHAMMLTGVDALGLGADDVLLPVAPFFHANGWGAPIVAPMAGAKLVLPGARLDPESLVQLIQREAVTIAIGTPSLWMTVLGYLEMSGQNLGQLRRVVIGGAAAPEIVVRAFEDKHGVEVLHTWGMTETSALGAVSRLTGDLRLAPRHRQLAAKTKQGRPPFTVELKIVDEAGEELPHNGEAIGALKVRGAAAAKSYFKDDFTDGATDEHGWLDTGDMATIDARGFIAIVDRAKDIIRSGKTLISTLQLENIAADHPKVAEAAVIGVKTQDAGAKPLVFISLKPGHGAEAAEILRFVQERAPREAAPQDVVFVDALPHTATGKVDKTALREGYEAGLPTRRLE